MNRFFSHLAENTIDLGFYALRGLTQPNPFRKPSSQNPWWCVSNPEDFYAVPSQPPAFKFLSRLKIGQDTRIRFTYPSSYQSPFPENNVVHGLADLRPAARGALIFLHGHGMSSFWLLEWFARLAIRQDLDLYYLALPYHMRRTPRGSWSGQHSLNSHIEETALAFMQGVRDVRSLITLIEAERRMPVALAGVSLGAFTACMTTVVDPRPRALISLLGGASLARIPWDGYQLGMIRRQLKAGGISLDQLENYWSLLSPGNWRPQIDLERILLIGGQYDPIVTPENVDALWQAWGRPEICWYPCGHITIALYYTRVAREIARFLDQKV